jgi:hypothetical protein
MPLRSMPVADSIFQFVKEVRELRRRLTHFRHSGNASRSPINAAGANRRQSVRCHCNSPGFQSRPGNGHRKAHGLKLHRNNVIFPFNLGDGEHAVENRQRLKVQAVLLQIATWAILSARVADETVVFKTVRVTK